jgi:hypothetical protein
MFAVLPVAHRATSPSQEQHVVQRVTHPDGTTSVTILEVPAGSTANQLSAQLKLAGVTGLVEANAGQVSALASTCQYGYALGLEDNPNLWPCVHWNNNGYNDPQVYFRDFTPAEWPVNASVYEWNKAVGVDSYYIWYNSANCPSTSTGKHCVNVYQGTCPIPGLSGKVGCTEYSYDLAHNFIDGTVRVWLNSALDGNGEDNRGTTGHELGHALGVGHNQRDPEKSSSCMGMSIPGPDHGYPNSEDYNLLKCRVYPPFPAGC